MNCEQFENRVQHLLDERASLKLDLQLQQHARECVECCHTLGVYECFATLPGSGDDLQKVGLAESSIAKPGTGAWKSSQRQYVQRRFILAAAAMLFISFILVARPGDAPPVAFVNVNEIPAEETTNVHPASSGSSLFDLGNFWDSSRLWDSTTAYVDFSSIGRIDLTTWIPEQPARVVQSIPATIESIEPFYRYSTDLPVLKQWSSGINYTIGLIQFSLPQPSSPVEGDDLGSRLGSGSPDLC